MTKWIKKGNYNSVSEILTARGISDVERSYTVKNIKEASQMIRTAVDNKQYISVIADYDVDGVMSALNMCKILLSLHARFKIILPDRESEGYGISDAVLKRLPDKENMLVITIDNGIAAVEYVEKIKKMGHDVLIIDHHLKRDDGKIPDCLVVDPHVMDGSDFDGYCGAGLAYKLAQELKITGFTMDEITTYAGFATIQDSMVLLEENRVIVKKMLENIRNGKVPSAVKYLISETNLDGIITEEDVKFYLGPIINAPGRLMEFGATFAYNAFLYNDRPKLDKMIETNQERKDETKAEQEIVEAIIKEQRMENDNFIVVYSPEINPGIMGIIASRVVDKYNVPAIIFTKVGDVLKGSGRSPEGINLKAELDRVSPLLLGFGGHPAAAGMSMKEENLEEFRKALNNNVNKLEKLDIETYDLDICPGEVSEMFDELVKTGPFGEGNPVLKFKINNFDVVPSENGMYKKVGADGYLLTSNETTARAFDGFNKYQNDGLPKQINIYGTIVYNHYNCEPQVQIIDYEIMQETEEESDLLSSLLACM